MNGKENIQFIVDTGATVNLIEESDYLKMSHYEERQRRYSRMTVKFL